MLQYIWIVMLGIIYVAWVIRSLVDLVIMIVEIKEGYEIDHGVWFVICAGAHLLVLFLYSIGLWAQNH